MQNNGRIPIYISTTTPSLTDIVYRYDTCTNGKGRLCEVNAHNAATTTYVYNPIGLVATESRHIGTARATTSTSYLRTGAVDTLTYPDGHQIVYVYDDAAMLNRVLGLTPGTTTWSALIESTTYAPTGAPLVVDYGNNTKTTYTYDATKLYRLTRKFTESTSTTPLTPEQLLFLAEALDNPDALLPLLETGTDTTTPSLPASSIPLLDLVPLTATSAESMGEIVSAIPETAIRDDMKAIVPSEPTAPAPEVLSDEIPVSTVTSTSDRVPLRVQFLELPTTSRATAKGLAIASLGPIRKTRQGEYFIEILNIEPIDGGVQVFARAWDAQNRPIGFGKDGTVEIERFRIFNPPILVPDGTTRTVTGPDGTEHQIDNFKEDLHQALLTTLAHTIRVKKEKFDTRHIVPGKVGNTTSVYYPESGAYEDGVIGTRTSESYIPWATLIDEAGDTTIDTANCFGVGALWENGPSGGNNFSDLYRGRMTFNTASLPDTDQISNATLSLYGDCKGATAYGIDVSIYNFATAPASNSALSNSDFDRMGTTKLSDTTTSHASWTTSGYNDFALNASGIAQVSISGASHFALRSVTHDVGEATPPTSGGYQAWVSAYAVEQSGTTNDPKLVVEHSSSAPEYPATTTLQDLRYTYDAVGNITSLQDLSGTRSYASTSYQYDNLYRLTRASSTLATTTDWLQTYTYNDLGNLLTKSDVGSYTYAGTGFANPHAPTTINGVTYSYDNAGNLTSKGTQTFTWDAWNRLQESANAGTTTAYTYDHTGQRVSQSVNRGSGTTTTIYWSKLYQTEGSTTTLSIFLPDGTLLATVEGNGVSTTTSIIHTDHLNSVALTSDKNGTLSELSAYYPYGAHRITDLPSSGTNVERGYIGQHEDGATTLSYLQARYYDGGRGQFLSIDPVFLRDPNRQNLVNPQSFNSYAYANGNPVGLSDPSGEAGGPPGRQSFSSFNAWASASLSWAQSTLTSMQASVTQTAKSAGSSVSSGYQSYSSALQKTVQQPTVRAINSAVNTVNNFNGGAGVTFGAEASLGVRAQGAGGGASAQASYSAGVFVDKGLKFSVGAYKSRATGFGAGNIEITSSELNMCPTPEEQLVIFGISGGAGVGGFVAPNAGSVHDLLDTANTTSLNLPFAGAQYTGGEQPVISGTVGIHMAGILPEPGASFTQLPVESQLLFSTY